VALALAGAVVVAGGAVVVAGAGAGGGWVRWWRSRGRGVSARARRSGPTKPLGPDRRRRAYTPGTPVTSVTESYSRQQTALIELPCGLRPKNDTQWGCRGKTTKLSSLLTLITIDLCGRGASSSMRLSLRTMQTVTLPIAKVTAHARFRTVLSVDGRAAPGLLTWAKRVLAGFWAQRAPV
jgi:hypothetical protein